MKVIAIQTSPNVDGLTATIAQHAVDGAAAAGAETELIHLKKLSIEACRQCENGWGRCRREGLCIIEDDFQTLREVLHGADALVISTPVYFGDVSEVAKSFLDRLRRCELHQPGPLQGKFVLAIAAAGGSGGGTVSCQEALAGYCVHLRMRIFDLIPVTRLTREYKLQAARLAGEALVRAATTES